MHYRISVLWQKVKGWLDSGVLRDSVGIHGAHPEKVMARAWDTSRWVVLKEWRWRWTLASSKKTKVHHEYGPLFIPVCSPIEPVDKVAAAREFRVLQAALHTSTAYRDSVGWLDLHADSLLIMSVSAAGSGSLGTCLSSCSLIPGVQDAEQQGIPRPDHRGNTWAEQRSRGSRYDCRQKWFVMWGVLKIIHVYWLYF